MRAMAHLSRWLVAFLILSTFARPAEAAPGAAPPATAPTLPAIPPLLAPWVPWVLESAGDARCPVVDDIHVCVWPSALSVDVAGNAATFRLRVTTDRDRDVALPGSSEHWPIDVQVDGERAPVLEPEGTPTVHVLRGLHVIDGRFLFAEAPTSLRVPPNVGALSLKRNGVLLAHPKREDSGMVWIEESENRDESEERLTLSVHRRIEDGVPLRVITRILVSAAGKPREIVFDEALLRGARPIELRADLPAQLSPSGSLRMQAQGGSYRIEIVAIIETPVKQLIAPTQPAPWPDSETWVFKGDDQLRHVELAGPPQIDSSRTDLDADWLGLPTFMLASGQAISFETRRRGEPEPSANRLTLERGLWLDLDGDGYTVRDQLRGTMRQGFRLELEHGLLGRAVVSGRDELITRRGNKSGIELRTSQVDLATEWRLEHGQSRLPAVGYSENVESLSAQLNLPPGFMLLGVAGADAVRGTWMDSWDLFDFFCVLLIALAVGKLSGAGHGALALFALVLTQHEQSAPGVSWIMLLIATALLRALSGHGYRKLARGLFGGSLLVLLWVLIPFCVEQVRTAFYPQLADTGAGDREWTLPLPGGMAARPEPMLEQSAIESAAAPLQIAPPAEDSAGAGSADMSGFGGARGSLRKLGKSRAGSHGGDSYDARELLDPSAVVQTGPGLPSWHFREFALGWSGPVARDERIVLYILPPLVTRLWSLLSAALSGVLLWILLRAARVPPQKPRARRGSPLPPPPDIMVTVLSLLFAFVVPAVASAQTPPSPELLQQLSERLLKAPSCAPNCVSVPNLALALGDQRLDIRIEVHAGEGGVYRAPGPLDPWAIDRIRIDNEEAVAAARLEDGFLHVRVPPGIHILELSGPIPESRASTLALGSPTPHRVEAHGRGWVIEGLHADGSSEASLELRREVASSNQASDEQALTQWLEVRRELELGLRFKVKTTLTRLGPASESVLVRLPLLPGESVNEAGLSSDNGSLVVTLPRDEQSFSFASTLQPRARLELTAATPSEAGELKHPYSEIWQIRPSSLYRPRFDGIAPVTQLGPDARYAPTYRPWPGEKLTVYAERLEPADGSSVTIDGAELRFTPGARIEESKLTLTLRASRGTTERINLPKKAVLSALEIDGRPHPARLKQATLELPLEPGSHKISVTFTRPVSLGFRYAPEAPSIGRPITNLHTSVALPDDRWLLATQGPAWGPAILWWGYVVLVIVAAVALGRLELSPLRSYQWALLGLGLTQVDTPVTLIVVGWLFALAYRERMVVASRRLFYLIQAMLVLFTATALGCLAYAVHQGLVVSPDMQVQGMLSSHNFVQWYSDRTPGDLPPITVWTAPVWIYKALMLLWALWLAAALIQWLRWGWVAFRKGSPRHHKPPPNVPSGGGTAQRRTSDPQPSATDTAKATDPDPKRARVS
ncbi:MAG: hypothetical protein JWN04_736 [Myxococcaceae bacterium]|nr:hypothetical protein [Myxococcaceae bacterium]